MTPYLTVIYFNSQSEDPNSFSIDARRERNGKSATFSIGSRGRPVKDTGNFSYLIAGFYIDNGVYLSNYFDAIDKTKTVSFIITKLDTVDHIISGTFGFTLMNSQDTSQEVVISDGRFDVHYPN